MLWCSYSFMALGFSIYAIHLAKVFNRILNRNDLALEDTFLSKKERTRVNYGTVLLLAGMLIFVVEAYLKNRGG